LLIYSDEDTDLKALVSSWLKSQPEHDQDLVSGWIEDYFYKGVDWVLKQVSLHFKNSPHCSKNCFICHAKIVSLMMYIYLKLIFAN